VPAKRGRSAAPSSADGLSLLHCRAAANARTHKTLRARPVDRLAQERLASLPATMPDCARRWAMRVPSDPYLRVDTNDYSLDPALVGRAEILALKADSYRLRDRDLARLVTPTD
jgi:hypothetical protein